ncbi:PEP-CTERM sorting domain-containing protein [Luteolibacter sp. Populi]|uniref:PEP-CTERM sorting domain-containing protein n=1 Tax=Luteolibacter sp. Populi TaxID=3230487 RepID=UPI003467BD1C
MENLTTKLAAYLGAGIGAGCLAGQSEAATIVTLYGPGAQSTTSTPSTPGGFDIGFGYYPGSRYVADSGAARLAFSNTGRSYFTTGGDLDASTGLGWGFGTYLYEGAAVNGVILNSDQNFANISFNGADGIYEGVGQFYLTGDGTGYLVALAINDDNSALSISAGVDAIEAVPEPSGLALLALGAGGLMMRRRRKAA